MQITLIYIINTALLIGISMTGYSKYKRTLLRAHYWPALILKVLCGILLGQLFLHHYRNGDTLMFYDQALALTSLEFAEFFKAITASTVPSQPVRAIYFVRITAVLQWLTHADYWLLSAYFSLFSFLGSSYLINKLTQWKPMMIGSATAAFYYFPSIIFWSSGLLKESLTFGAVTFLIGAYLSWRQSKKTRLKGLFIGFLAAIILVSIKYYIAAVFLPLLIFLIMYHQNFWDNRKIFSLWKKSILLAFALLLPVLFFLSWLNPNLSFSVLWEVMNTSHQEYLLLAPEGALYALYWFGNDLDILINLPYLWFSGIFRPLVGEDITFPALFSCIENSLLLIGALYGLYNARKKSYTWSIELVAIVIYISALSIFLSYSAPNFGTLARFKIYYLPFVVLLILNTIPMPKFLWNN